MGERTLDIQALTDRVLGMFGTFLAEQEKAKALADKEMPEDEKQQKPLTKVQEILANTSPVAAVSEKCVSPEARDAIKG